MFFPNPFNLSEYSDDFSERDDIDKSIISSTPLNDILNETPSFFNFDKEEKDKSQLLNFFGKNTNSGQETKKKKPLKFLINNKRGRIPKGVTKKENHDSSKYDNIIRKIQTHFLNFIVNFLNDCVHAFSLGKKYYFKKFDYKVKSDILTKNFNKLKSFTIGDILNYMGVSRKFKKNNDKTSNEKNMKILCKFSEFKEIFDIKYLELFSLYYNNEQPLKEICLSGKTIILRAETKSFYYLLEKNKDLKEYIIAYAKMSYLDDNNSTETD